MYRIYTTKLLLIMKLTVVILICAMMQVSAATFGQSLTYNQQNTTLEKVFNEIKKQTGYRVLYADKGIDASQKLSVNFKNTPLKEVLEVCLEQQSLTYVFDEQSIVIKANEPSTASVILNLFQDLFQSIDVRGRVVDSETGNGLAGATVRVKTSGSDRSGGKNKQTSTNAKGEFYLADVEENAVLEISFIGYVKKEVKAGKDLGEIRLVIASADLQEVTINKGYYSTTRTLNTGNVSTVTADEIARQPVSDPLLALQGRVPGLFIQQQGGNTGREVKVRLRGQNSIANGNSPLFIVDGLQFSSTTFSKTNTGGLSKSSLGGNMSPFEFLNPADIESIEVLKDADATAIYGSRGANGVILITTKGGKSGKTQLDINIYTGYSTAPQRVEFLNTQEYLAMRRQAFINDNQNPTVWDYDLNGRWSENDYTNWQDLFIGGTEELTEGSASISGGSQSTTFRIGGTFRDQGTVYPGDFSYIKASTQFNIKHVSQDGRFNALLTGQYLINRNKLPIADFNPASNYTLAPNFPKPFNEDGTLNWAPNQEWGNPMSYFLRKATESGENLLGNLELSYKLTDKLQLGSMLSYNSQEFRQTNLIPFTTYNPATTQYSSPADLRYNEFSTNNQNAWTIEPKLSYQNTLYKGIINITLGTTIRSANQDYIAMSATGFSSDALLENFAAGTSVQTRGRTYINYKYNSFFARIGYSYNKKYVLNLTANRDGSSRFGSENKFGNFGAIGAAWVFSNESFVKEKLAFFNFGKLRMSYGTAGNDQILDYGYLDTYQNNTNFYQGINSLVPTQLTNSSYGWERVNKLEFALETGFFNNKLLFSAALFRNRTKNQLVRYGLPTVAGFNGVTANLPATLQNGGLEFDVTSKNIQQNSFSWSTSANITFPNSKLVSYHNLAASSYATTYALGEPLFLAYSYHFIGLNPDNQQYIFQDINGDGSITSTFDRLFRFNGQKFYGGIQNSIRFRNVELDFLFQFTKQTGRQYLINNVGPGFFNGGNGNQPVGLLGSGLQQKITQSDYAYYFSHDDFVNFSDGTFGDASYLRLKNISLAWQIPLSKKTQRYLEYISVYCQGQNLMTITKYKGSDPENASNSIQLPALRTITIGLKASF